MEVDGKRGETDIGITSEQEDTCICEPCQRGKATAKAVGLCRECEEYMCQTCFDHHLKAKICMNHSLVGDLKSSVSVKGRFQDVERCEHHENEIVKYYCRKHDTVGCGDCMLSGGHNACKPEYIKNVAKNFMNEKAFQDLVRQAEDIETDKKLTANLNQESRRKTKELREKAVNEVRKFRTDINNALDTAEANIRSKIKTVASENDEKLTTMEKAIESVSVELEEVKMKMNTELHGRNALFINAVGCKSQLNQIAQSLDDATSKTILKLFSFNPDESLRRLATSAKSLGSLRITDHEKTVTTKPEIPSVKLASCTENSKNKKDTCSGNRIEDCIICMEEMNNPKTLKCGHRFCSKCIDIHFEIKQTCPTCGAVCRIITGDQPDGTMTVSVVNYTHCAGYSGCGQIIITYNFPSGRQGPNHPKPGQLIKGITRQAFLPGNKEGQLLLQMLKVAFDRKLVFTIGYSRTTGQEGVITWNEIHHKTDPRPNTQFGYPDPTYLERLRQELAAKGVTERDIM